MKFRPKPLEVDARRLGVSEDEDLAIMRWCGGVPTKSVIEGAMFHVATGSQLESLAWAPLSIARLGDWIVMHTNKTLSVLSDAEFRERYEAVAEEKKPAAKPAEPKA